MATTNVNFGALALAGMMLFMTTTTTMVEGHGYMTSPRARNWVAHEDGTDGMEANKPRREYCYHCLNRKAADEVCGTTTTQNYDDWLDIGGNPIPWSNEAVYTEGQLVTIKSYLSAPHWGHQEVMVCADGISSTQECFESNYLEFIEDVSGHATAAPKDPNYPMRGHFTDKLNSFEMIFQLPMGVTGGQVMMQWRYVTANSCWPPGYSEYPYPNAKGGNSAECHYPLNPTGATGADDASGKTNPEQFWNCAEITILPANPAAPPPSPTPPTPTPPSPTPPTSDSHCCSFDYKTCVNDDWCNALEIYCDDCRDGGAWISTSLESSTCVALYEQCTDSDDCCGSSECTSLCDDYSQCTPPAPVTMLSCCMWPGDEETCSPRNQPNNVWCHANQSQCESCSGTWITVASTTQ